MAIASTTCHYYTRLISEHKEQLKSENLAALDVLEAERDNARAALNWAMSHHKVTEVNLFMECL